MPTTEIRPLILDEYPIDFTYGSMNLYVREGDDMARLAITDKPRDYDEDELDEEDRDEDSKTTGIDMDLDAEELFRLALAGGDALAALGRRDDLAELIKSLTDTLCKMR